MDDNQEDFLINKEIILIVFILVIIFIDINISSCSNNKFAFVSLIDFLIINYNLIKI